MTEQWTTTIHDASELPPKNPNDANHEESIKVLGVGDESSWDEDWQVVYYDFKLMNWFYAAKDEVATVLHWFEKPPVQKKKEKREIDGYVYDEGGGAYTFCTFENFSSPSSKYISKGKLIYEE